MIEPGAVEARRAAATPDVRNTQVLHGDADDPGVLGRRQVVAAGLQPVLRLCVRRGDRGDLGCRALGGKPGACLRLEQRLSGALLRLHLPDLVLHGGEQLPALRQLLVGVLLLRRLVGDELSLPLARLRERRAAGPHLTPELLHVAEHRGVLLSDALGDVEAGQDVVEALGAEDDLDRTLLRPR